MPHSEIFIECEDCITVINLLGIIRAEESICDRECWDILTHGRKVVEFMNKHKDHNLYIRQNNERDDNIPIVSNVKASL